MVIKNKYYKVRGTDIVGKHTGFSEKLKYDMFPSYELKVDSDTYIWKKEKDIVLVREKEKKPEILTFKVKLNGQELGINNLGGGRRIDYAAIKRNYKDHKLILELMRAIRILWKEYGPYNKYKKRFYKDNSE